MCCAKGLPRCGLCPKIFALDVPAEPPSNGTRGLFRESNFPRFWSARVGSMAAYQMQTVAVAWQIYHLTGSAFDLGLVGLVGFLPRLLLTLPAGHLADHADRRLSVAACQLLKALAVALLVVATLEGWVGRELIFAAVFLSGCARTFEMPTSQALLPGLVAPGVLPTAVALSSAAVQGATIVGPALGGFLYAVGPELVFGLAALLGPVGAVLRVWHPRGGGFVDALVSGLGQPRAPGGRGAARLRFFCACAYTLGALRWHNAPTPRGRAASMAASGAPQPVRSETAGVPRRPRQSCTCFRGDSRRVPHGPCRRVSRNHADVLALSLHRPPGLTKAKSRC